MGFVWCDIYAYFGNVTFFKVVEGSIFSFVGGFSII